MSLFHEFNVYEIKYILERHRDGDVTMRAVTSS